MTHDKIVSIGFLTRRDLERLGETFTRHMPVPEDGRFDDLIARLDQL
jgi:hypothetical protein